MNIMTDHLSAHEAAERVGLEYKTFLQRITRGQVDAVKIGRTLLIHRDELTRLEATEKVRKKKRRIRGHPLYSTYVSMKRRCYNPKAAGYHRYGGRGIKVCDRWLSSFENFVEDMGEKPTSEHTLDRYPNNDGNYEPSNCRWATRKEQSENRG